MKHYFETAGAMALALLILLIAASLLSILGLAAF
jgi:hypothetical protein